jgi:hypothetical protein
MIGFLLFAGAIRVDLTYLRRFHSASFLLATLGVILSMQTMETRASSSMFRFEVSEWARSTIARSQEESGWLAKGATDSCNVVGRGHRIAAAGGSRASVW